MPSSQPSEPGPHGCIDEASRNTEEQGTKKQEGYSAGEGYLATPVSILGDQRWTYWPCCCGADAHGNAGAYAPHKESCDNPSERVHPYGTHEPNKKPKSGFFRE